MTTSYEGKRIELNPQNNKLEMYSNSGNLVLSIGFMESDINYDIPVLDVSLYINGLIHSTTAIRGDSVFISNENGRTSLTSSQINISDYNDVYSMELTPKGITLYELGNVVKEFKK